MNKLCFTLYLNLLLKISQITESNKNEQKHSGFQLIVKTFLEIT